MLLWALSALARARLAAGDVAAALPHAEDGAALGARADFHAAGQPGWCLGAALAAAGNAERGGRVLLEAFGGPALAVLARRAAAAAADLVEAQLAAGDLAGAEATLALAAAAAAARAGTAWAAGARSPRPPRSRAGLLAARAAGAAAPRPPRPPPAPYARRSLPARARLLAGPALAGAGDRAPRCGARRGRGRARRLRRARRRDEAVRELRRLGHRVVRPPRDGRRGPPAHRREREIAELVAAGRTNREVAEQLVLSPRTIEAHLRKIYGIKGFTRWGISTSLE